VEELGQKASNRSERAPHALNTGISFEEGWSIAIMGLRHLVEPRVSSPPHVEEGWGRFRPGPHVAAARWVGRGCADLRGPAGSTCGTKAPPPVGGGAPMGAGRRLRPSLLDPHPCSLGTRTHSTERDFLGACRDSLRRGSASETSLNPLPGSGDVCGTVQVSCRIGLGWEEDEELVHIPPLFLSLDSCPSGAF
jgi:hypothetical protein